MINLRIINILIRLENTYSLRKSNITKIINYSWRLYYINSEIPYEH